MRNETIWGFVTGLFLGLAVMFCMGILGGCATTGLQGKDAELVAANARNAGRIESSAENLGELVGRSQERLEIVSRASEKIADGVQRLEFLLSEYELEVERLLAEIDRLRAQQEKVGD
jgi:hypothetical protein